jgi:hypothetical protein
MGIYLAEGLENRRAPELRYGRSCPIPQLQSNNKENSPGRQVRGLLDCLHIERNLASVFGSANTNPQIE